MITIFSIPKAFEGHIGTIQTNAIKSWKKIPNVEIVLFGDESGVEEFTIQHNLTHFKSIKKNNLGTPLVSDAFNMIKELCSHDLIMYSNSDIIYLTELHITLKNLKKNNYTNFLGCGQRHDLNIKNDLDFGKKWSTSIKLKLLKEGLLHSKSGLDYFIFTRDAMFNFPELAVGRPGWDNWLIYQARKKNIKLVDFTNSILAIHQNHSPKYKTYGIEGIQNKKNVGGYFKMATLNDANWTAKNLDNQLIFKKRLKGEISFFFIFRYILGIKREIQEYFNN